MSEPPSRQEPEPLHLAFAAVSDVGRIRKDNQDSGYAGPWLLAVCDGVGGAARGDVASSTAISELRRLDVPPAPAVTTAGSETVPVDLLDRVTEALHNAHAEIGRLVDEDPALNGTSTTATVALFDRRRIGIGHVGDSRAYLFRDRELSQLTTDHTFVQSLIDEGRITEAEARVHPHRNLILKALDGVHEAEPDLFVLELVPGDRLFLCSDGACGVLDDGRIADILSMGTPDFAAVEMVRASLDAGSSDNVTCLVADVLGAEGTQETTQEGTGGPGATGPTDTPVAGIPAVSAVSAGSAGSAEPLVVGAAAELPRRTSGRTGPRSLFRGHRSGDTGELEPIEAELPDEVPFAIPSDPIAPDRAELVRYAPRPPERFVVVRRLLLLVVALGLVWVAAAGAWAWMQRQYYVGQKDGVVVIYRGVQADLPGIDLDSVVETSDLRVDQLFTVAQQRVTDGIPADDLADAERKLAELGDSRDPNAADSGTSNDPTASPTTSPTAGPSGDGGSGGSGEPTPQSVTSPPTGTGG